MVTGPDFAPPRTRAVVESNRWQRLAAPTATTVGLGLLTAALHVRDPHDQNSWGLCPSAALGFWCPGCGGLRAVNDLTNADLGAAASSNLLLVAAMPFAVVALALWGLDRWRDVPGGARYRRLSRFVPVLLVVVIGFTVARNFAFGSWLAP
jgi:hypothetical protein